MSDERTALVELAARLRAIETDPKPNFDMQAFQEAGKPHRQRLGIDGTAGDAQDVPHPATEDGGFLCCVVCGLALQAKIHIAGGVSLPSHRPSSSRGWCPVCERDIEIKKDGTLRHHGGPVGDLGMWNTRRRPYRCAGAGLTPGVKPEVSS